MKKIIILFLALLVALFIYKNYGLKEELVFKETLDSSCTEHEPADLYYDPEEYYKNYAYLKAQDGAGIIQESFYSSDLKYYLLRPLYTEIAVETSYLKKFIRNCSRPKYGDLVFLEVLLPEFISKTESNYKDFSYRNSSDVLTIRAGGLSSDLDIIHFRANIQSGKWIKANENEDVTEYVLSDGIEGNLTSYYVYKNIKSITGKPILVKCFDGAAETKSQLRCMVRLFLPKELWEKDTYAYTQMSKGLNVSYWFKHKHLDNLKEVHEYVVKVIDQIFIDISIPDAST